MVRYDIQKDIWWLESINRIKIIVKIDISKFEKNSQKTPKMANILPILTLGGVFQPTPKIPICILGGVFQPTAKSHPILILLVFLHQHTVSRTQFGRNFGFNNIIT